MVDYWHGNMVAETLLPGETIQRSYKPEYPHYVAEFRKGNIDFAVCKELQHMLVNDIPKRDGWIKQQLEDAFKHLSDAANEDLPMPVREQHFDIAGSMVWNAYYYGMPSGYGSTMLPEWIGMWKRAGGL